MHFVVHCLEKFASFSCELFANMYAFGLGGNPGRRAFSPYYIIVPVVSLGTEQEINNYLLNE